MSRGWRRVLALLAALACSPVMAAGVPSDHPFAKHFLALQLSEADAGRQALVLSVANNMLRAYGPDNIAIEVVTFGPGVHLLYARNVQRKAVISLMEQGVRFDVCDNTLDSIKRKQGQVPPLDPGVKHVAAGVARLLDLSEHGYALVRP